MRIDLVKLLLKILILLVFVVGFVAFTTKFILATEVIDKIQYGVFMILIVMICRNED